MNTRLFDLQRQERQHQGHCKNGWERANKANDQVSLPEVVMELGHKNDLLGIP